MTYTGTMMRDLLALVKKGEPDGWQILVNARIHLCDQIMDAGDVQAWFELGDLQECLELGLTEFCVNCGEMEGLHHVVFSDAPRFCRKQSLSGNQRLSRRFCRAEGYPA